MTKANNESVWISCMINSALDTKFTVLSDGRASGSHGEMSLEEEKFWGNIGRNRYKAGFHLSGDERPKEFAPWRSFSPASNHLLPDCFQAQWFYCISERFANVLRGFDLGEGSLDPVTFYRKDRKTALPGPYYLLNFGCRKNALVPEQSNPQSTAPPPPPQLP